MVVEGQEDITIKLKTARNLYKTCLACVQELDKGKKLKNAKECFQSSLGIRRKLLEAGEALLFLDPPEYAKKVLDLIWKKCFYDPIQQFRQKKLSLNPEEKAWLSLLLESAAGFYHAFLLKMQMKFSVKTPAFLCEIPFAIQDKPDNASDWVDDTVYKVLLSLGDINRYQIEFERKSEHLAKWYYSSAVLLKPQIGMAHNQLGTLHLTKRPVLAVYHYLRCIIAADSYDGAIGNLSQLLQLYKQNQSDNHEQQSRLDLRLIAKLFDNEMIVSEAYDLLEEFPIWLQSVCAEEKIEGESVEEGLGILALVFIAIVESCEKLADINTLLATDIFFEFVVFLTRQTLDMYANADDEKDETPSEVKDESLVLESGDEAEEDDGASHRRIFLGRRRKGSDSSEDEVSDHESTAEEDVIELVESDGPESPVPQIKTTNQTLSKKIAVETEEKTAKEFNYFPSLILCLRYTLAKPGFLQQFAAKENKYNFYQYFCKLLQSLPPCEEEKDDQHPLPEDYSLRGFPVFECYLTRMDFSQKPSILDYEKVRRERFYSLAVEISKQDNSILCLSSEGKWSVRELKPTFPDKSVDSRNLLMKNMANLRMKDELAQLERIGWIPVYLIPESGVLINRLHALKLLVNAHKFVTVIPDSVIHELDRMKKDSPSAREAIRWLEQAFHRGTKFLRPQKKTERKEASLEDETKHCPHQLRELKGIIECARYLGGTVGGEGNLTTVVTVLTLSGSDSDFPRLLTTAMELNSITGANVQNIHAFLSKWQRHDRKGKKGG